MIRFVNFYRLTWVIFFIFSMKLFRYYDLCHEFDGLIMVIFFIFLTDIFNLIF